MINVDRNPNFTEWYDIRLFGRLIDNARSYAKAMSIAKGLQKKYGLGIFACYTRKKDLHLEA